MEYRNKEKDYVWQKAGNMLVNCIVLYTRFN